MNSKSSLSLSDLNTLVRGVIEEGLPDSYWVHAELSSVNVNASGHCYLELIEKDASGRVLVAKARAVIWANMYRILRVGFEQISGQALVAGICVLLQVSVEFHEVYGLTYVVQDIDPTYTIGDMIRRRREIIQRLRTEGILNMNKELPLPLLPQRVAVISSETAAGYGDFCRQLVENAYGFFFSMQLFPAIMQGDRVEESTISALDAIAMRQDDWDVVVIIRGGGAVSDLAGFESYELASACAQFPLPIIVGIGHDRDQTVLDEVAHTSVKTPTAVADFLIERMQMAAGHLEQCAERITAGLAQRVMYEQQRVQKIAAHLPTSCRLRMVNEDHTLDDRFQRLTNAIKNQLSTQRNQLVVAEKVVLGASPEIILQRGYSITRINGRAVRCAADVQTDDVLQICLYDGEVYSKVLFHDLNDKKDEV